MSVRVRIFAERDYAAVSRIRSTGEQDPTAPLDLRAADARWDHPRYETVRAVDLPWRRRGIDATAGYELAIPSSP